MKKKHDVIYNRIRYLISQKGGITYVIFHNYARIKVDSYDCLPLDNYYYNIFLAKCP